MASEDKEVLTVSEFRAGLDGLKVYIDGRLIEINQSHEARMTELQKEIQVLEHQIELNATKIDMLQHYQTLGFALLGGMIAFAAVIVAIAPSILEVFREKRKTSREEDMRKIAREEFSRLNMESVSKNA